MVDRLFRDLLVDLTGNTHRAEICIDKMFSPDSSTGRLGLVELRGFEMPPHPQMSLATTLLIRGIVAAFWDHPYREPIVDWGSRLHDRFLLSSMVRQDLHRVCEDLATRDICIDPDWFTAQFEFRFPTVGSIHHDGHTLTLRDAIEPWMVMGEEPGASGTVRYVDSSLERLEAILQTDQIDQIELHCNGVRVPMTPLESAGHYVAGIRFRAWQPPRCLHPTIGVDAPLKFELVSRQTGLAIGGCTYHVVHPGGRGTDAFPVNANEAESRRAARFESIGIGGGVRTPHVVPAQHHVATADHRDTARSDRRVTLDMRTIDRNR